MATPAPPSAAAGRSPAPRRGRLAALTQPRFTVRPLPDPQPVELPAEFDRRRLLRRALGVAAGLGVLVLVALLAPGLDEVRRALQDADPAWIVAAVALEALSGVSYVLLFRPVFCSRMSWRTTWEIGWTEQGVGSIVPASGAAGIALGAWVLKRGGMSPEHIAERSIAFLLIKSGVNFVAVAVLGTVMALGLVGPDVSLWLTAFPAALAVAAIAAVVLVGRLGPGPAPSPAAGRARRWWAVARRAVVRGTAGAGTVLRSGEPLVFIGGVGYWLFDNLVLWAAFQAVGADVSIWVILLGYLIGQLGGALPLPGGIGGVDGGLIGFLMLFGAPAAATVAAVIAYRLILFWLPLLAGAVAFVSLQRGLNRPDRPDLCPVPATVEP